MAGQDRLHRRLGPHTQQQRVRKAGLGQRAVVQHLAAGRERRVGEAAGQGGELGFQQGALTGEALGVAAAGIDRAPVEGSRDDGRLNLGQGVEDRLVVRIEAHGANLPPTRRSVQWKSLRQNTESLE